MLIALQKSVTRLLLGLYVLAVFKPLYPYLEYAFNKNYIVQQICENRAKPELKCEGSCYLSKRLAQAEAPQRAQHCPLPAKNNIEQDSFHLQQAEAMIGARTTSGLPLNFALVSQAASQFVPDIFHPPRTASSLL